MWRLVFIGAAVVVGAALYWRLSRWWLGRVLQKRRRRGRQGELDAAWLLLDAGYEILEDQTTREVTLQVDGESKPYQLRPDYLVRREGRLYVAEVKTGKKAPNPLYTPTRRQLMEYEVCYPDHGLLLVDMESRLVHQVGWRELEPGFRPHTARHMFWLLGGAFGLGVLVGVLVASL